MSKLYVVEISPMLRDPGIKIGKFLVTEEQAERAHIEIVEGTPIPVFGFRDGQPLGMVSFGQVFRVRTQPAKEDTEVDFLYNHPAGPITGDEVARNKKQYLEGSGERAAA